MKTKRSSSRMASILELYDLQTKLFINSLEGISDKDAQSRLNTKANHIAWLAGSVVEQRFEMANRLGLNKQQTAHDLFKNNQGIQDSVSYPPLDTYKEDWKQITPSLKDALSGLPDSKLDESIEIMPGMKMTSYELICFNSYREASIIGQIALWRRLLGYDPMKYM